MDDDLEGPYDLDRFIIAQQNTYERAVLEIRQGQKRVVGQFEIRS